MPDCETEDVEGRGHYAYCMNGACGMHGMMIPKDVWQAFPRRSPRVVEIAQQIQQARSWDDIQRLARLLESSVAPDLFGEALQLNNYRLKREVTRLREKLNESDSLAAEAIKPK